MEFEQFLKESLPEFEVPELGNPTNIQKVGDTKVDPEVWDRLQNIDPTEFGYVKDEEPDKWGRVWYRDDRGVGFSFEGEGRWMFQTHTMSARFEKNEQDPTETYFEFTDRSNERKWVFDGRVDYIHDYTNRWEYLYHRNQSELLNLGTVSYNTRHTVLTLNQSGEVSTFRRPDLSLVVKAPSGAPESTISELNNRSVKVIEFHEDPDTIVVQHLTEDVYGTVLQGKYGELDEVLEDIEASVGDYLTNGSRVGDKLTVVATWDDRGAWGDFEVYKDIITEPSEQIQIGEHFIEKVGRLGLVLGWF